MYETYRVLRMFQWRGFQYAKPGPCDCECNQDEERRAANECNGVTASACACPDSAYCSCHIPPDEYGGDIWIVEAGHPRKEHIVMRRFVTYDPSIPPADELLKQEKYSRLILDPSVRKHEPAEVS